MNLVNRALAVSIDLAHEPDFRLGALHVIPSIREVRSPRGCETVEPRVMQALVRLARAEGSVVSRDDLIQSCWGGRAVSEDAINRCIAKIRQLSESDETFAIETIPRVGYRLACATVLSSDKREIEGASEPSICVLPFANMSDDPQQEYFADGITEDIITDLHKVSSLFVVARNTAFTFKGKNVDVQQAAKQLGVGYVLEGSVRKVGCRVRITAQLVDGTTGGHVWAERYDRDLEDIFAVQDEISHSITRALRLKLVPEEDEAIGKRGTRNADAYRLYLMARQSYVRGGTCDMRAAEAVVRLCKRATEIDPRYARAWALMALGEYHAGQKERSGLDAAQRALALDGDLAEAHAVLAKILFEDGRREKGLEELALALRLDPESYDVNRVAAFLEYSQHHFERAAPYWEKALSVMEADIHSAAMLISCYKWLGDEEGIVRTAQLALARCERELALVPDYGLAMGCSAFALAAMGQADLAVDRMELAMLIDPDNPKLLYNFACACSAFLNDKERALGLLDAVVRKVGPVFLRHAEMDPDLMPVRDDPRFREMVAAAEARLAKQSLQDSEAA